MHFIVGNDIIHTQSFLRVGDNHRRNITSMVATEFFKYKKALSLGTYQINLSVILDIAF